MTCRNYIKQAGRVVAVEVIGTPNEQAIEAELRRIYGSSLRLGRWSRRGRKHRATIEGSTIEGTIGGHAFAWFEGTL